MSILAIGTMSGTSLDGMDIALCRFSQTQKGWKYDIEEATTITYPESWVTSLRNASSLNAHEFLMLHNKYGLYTGELIHKFISETGKLPLLIASHGHTIFHDPNEKLTFQLGNGASIAASTRLTTVSDFRILNVALGGQGAPLVPAGDQLLFADYEYCLNLGGFANISFEVGGIRQAYDICPVNVLLNTLAQQKGFSFDKNGMIGASGNINKSLLLKLNSLDYYHANWPKSIGREWVEKEINPLVTSFPLSVEDLAATVYEHISEQISYAMPRPGSVLITGGGAKNTFLMQRISSKTNCQLVIPDEQLVDYKEALIFALLGILALTGRENVYGSATGSDQNHIGGTIFRI